MRPNKNHVLVVVLLILTIGCAQQKSGLEILPRESKIPANATKITPETDNYPPILHSEEWEQPVPLPYPINSKGAEDSPFITPDGNTLYFTFVPDTSVPAHKQLIDGVTGLYVSHKTSEGWSEPGRVVLNDDVSLDGCEFVGGNIMWFCSVRAGNYREVDLYTAELIDGKWSSWKNVGEKLNKDYQVGEMHVSADGGELYFHSNREGTKGGYDIWVSRKKDGEWQEPENLEVFNTESNEGWPFISEDGGEFWFLRTHMGSPGVFRSKKINGSWTEPQLIVESFAGEPTLDRQGNLYFPHFFYENGTMIEADIYVAYKKQAP